MYYTPAQKKENVRKIRDYLASNSPPPLFAMGAFFISPTLDGELADYVPTDLSIYNECGTSACFAGHGPLAGIAPLCRESWDCYVERCFTDAGDSIFNWLFSAEWDVSPEHGTAAAAIARADIYLQSGIPDTFTFPIGWIKSLKVLQS